MIGYINGFEYDNDSEIIINEDLDFVDEIPVSYDLDEKKIIYPADSDIKEDQYLEIESNIYKIKSVEDNEENTLSLVVKQISEVCIKVIETLVLIISNIISTLL